MTHPTDEELDALVIQAQAAIDRVKPAGILSDDAKLSAALFALYGLLPTITALRTQLAELREELHGPIEQISAQDYSNVIAHLSPELETVGALPNRNSLMMALVEATNMARKDAARADRAEAALAASARRGCVMTASDEAKKSLEGAISEMTPGRAVQFHPQYCPEAKDADVKDWDTSHDLSVIRSDGSRYKIGHFRHASDALFDQLCRNHVPALLAEIAAKDAEIARLRHQIDEATDENFIWGAMDNVHDADTTLDDYAAAVSRAQRAALKGDTHE